MLAWTPLPGDYGDHEVAVTAQDTTTGETDTQTYVLTVTSLSPRCPADAGAPKTLYTDGWVVDKPWLTTLFHAAKLPMNFSVSPLEMILTERQMERWHQTKEKVLAEVKKHRHRASFDAWIVQETYKRTLAESKA